LGRAISLLGTAITSVVLPILVYRLTASALLTSLLATLEVLPYLLFGLFAGEVADRVDRRRLMVGCDLLNTFLLGSIPAAGWLHALTVPHIFVVALLSASAFVWFDAADFGAIPTLVGREYLVAATSAFASMSTIVGIIGPALAARSLQQLARMIAWGGTPFGAALGGLLAQATTVRTTYLILAVGIALSTLLGWFSPLRQRTKIHDLTASAP
jgi:MFS family permease